MTQSRQNIQADPLSARSLWLIEAEFDHGLVSLWFFGNFWEAISHDLTCISIQGAVEDPRLPTCSAQDTTVPTTIFEVDFFTSQEEIRRLQ